MGPRFLERTAGVAVALLACGSGTVAAQEAPRSAAASPGPTVEAEALRARSTDIAGGGGVSWVEREAYTMGTLLRLRLAAPDRARAVRISEAVLRTVEDLEEALSTWREDSETARANRAPVGEPVALSPGLGSLLAEAFRWHERTDGAFDPAVGALVDVWDLRGSGRRPSAQELDGALASTGSAAVRLDPQKGTLTRLSAAARVDAGAFGKGAALRRAREVLRDRGVERALLNFGGQMLAMGSGPGGAGGWRVAVADPRDRGGVVARLRITDASVSTTGASERFVGVADDTLGHVLDPRTGRPVPSWGSVTVVAPDPVEADVLSTALFVHGPDAALARAREHRDAAVLIVESRSGSGDRRVRWSPSMERWLDDESTPSRAGEEGGDR